MPQDPCFPDYYDYPKGVCQESRNKIGPDGFCGPHRPPSDMSAEKDMKAGERGEDAKMICLVSRKFLNEHGVEVEITISVHGVGADGDDYHVAIRGPNSVATNLITRLEIEQLTQALNEALSGDRADPREAVVEAVLPADLWVGHTRLSRGVAIRTAQLCINRRLSALGEPVHPRAFDAAGEG